MNAGHSAHEERILELLAEVEDPTELYDDPRLAECPRCQGFLREIEDMQNPLRTLGETEREEIAALRDELENVQRAPWTDQEEDLAREWTVVEASGSRLLWRLAPWAMAAAALLAVLWFVVPQDEELGLDETTLHRTTGDLTLLAPLGPTPEFGRFVWKGQLAPGETFSVRILDPSSADGAELLLVEHLEQHEWVADPDLARSWPDRIRWRVDIVSPGDGLPRDSQAAEAWRHP